jgi:hypothetical protein
VVAHLTEGWRTGEPGQIRMRICRVHDRVDRKTPIPPRRRRPMSLQQREPETAPIRAVPLVSAWAHAATCRRCGGERRGHGRPTAMPAGPRRLPGVCRTKSSNYPGTCPGRCAMVREPTRRRRHGARPARDGVLPGTRARSPQMAGPGREPHAPARAARAARPPRGARELPRPGRQHPGHGCASAPTASGTAHRRRTAPDARNRAGPRLGNCAAGLWLRYGPGLHDLFGQLA